jgi:hypothetical protein
LDARSTIRIAIFNYVIGNADAHGKNFSFLFAFIRKEQRKMDNPRILLLPS